MSNFSKIIIVILVILTFLFIKDKFGIKMDNLLTNLPKIELKNKITETVKQEEVKVQSEIIKDEQPPKQQEEKEYIWVYFLGLDSDSNGIYKRVKREIPKDENKLEFAIKELLKGPNIVEKASGIYSEIPQNTKLISIKQTGNKIIINLSSDFELGGGTDSIYSRMMQLIKTSVNCTQNKKIYLYLNGKQVNFIGGEGIMISQPLTEKSLEV